MVHQQINFMLEINTHGVIPANTYRGVGGRATHDYRDIGGRVTPGRLQGCKRLKSYGTGFPAVTEEAKAEAGIQSNNVPPGRRTKFTGYRISPADFPV